MRVAGPCTNRSKGWENVLLIRGGVGSYSHTERHCSIGQETRRYEPLPIGTEGTVLKEEWGVKPLN